MKTLLVEKNAIFRSDLPEVTSRERLLEMELGNSSDVVRVGLDDGLAAYPHIDPLIVADVTGNGSLSGLDAQRIAQEAVGLNPKEIPPLPQPLRLDRLPTVTTVSVRLTMVPCRPPVVTILSPFLRFCKSCR